MVMRSPHGGLQSAKVRAALYYARKRRLARLSGSEGGGGTFSETISENFDSYGEGVSPIPPWTGSANLVASASQLSVVPQSGTRFLKPNTFAPTLALTQDIDVSAYDTIIDAGGAEVEVSYYRARDSNTGDSARVNIQFLNGVDGLISSALGATGWPAAANVWELQTYTQDLPALTRTCRVQLQFSRGSGSELNAYLDTVEVEVRSK